MKPMEESAAAATVPAGRLMSLDFFRGLTMFLLIGEGAKIFTSLSDPALKGTLLGAFSEQFHHKTWDGLNFWDLIQPFFMFIVGVAMPFSIGKRWERGDGWLLTFRHVLWRSALLLGFGCALPCISAGKMTLQLWNVLAQLSFTYLMAFVMMRQSARVQVGFTMALLVLTELLYRSWSVPGFNQAFTPDQNFGSWLDMHLMGKLSPGHWVAFNAVPTTAHTMWGVLAGQVLKSERAPGRKVVTLLIAGLAGLLLGYALSPATPIIKRICTSSFVLASGGWGLVALAGSYWLIDVLQFRGWSRFFGVVGMNSIFIYLFTQVGGARMLTSIATPFTKALFAGAGAVTATILTSLVVWGMLWYLCCWLYQRRIFLRI